jgi:hypothetical protein
MTSAAAVGDNFSASATITSPIAGVGMDFPVCSLLGMTSCNSTEAATQLQFEVDEVFYDSTWQTGSTAASSAQGKVGNQTRFSARWSFHFGRKESMLGQRSVIEGSIPIEFRVSNRSAAHYSPVLIRVHCRLISRWVFWSWAMMV